MFGGKYFFEKTRVTVFEDSQIPGLNPPDFDLANSGLSIIGEYETLNNFFSHQKVSERNSIIHNRWNFWEVIEIFQKSPFFL